MSLHGYWAHGFASFTAIAASADVAQIMLTFDHEVHTNSIADIYHAWGILSGFRPAHACTEDAPLVDPHNMGVNRGIPQEVKRQRWRKPVQGDDGSTPSRGLHVKSFTPPVHMRRGDEIGWFEMGSGLVLAFEAPADYQLRKDIPVPGKQLYMGMRMDA